mmetsp:Transcript_11345/g.14743  ORF Transcript_11345/g.14743 Transcript_11345/m.14743 type:complete len:870 (-) Transcript_11345:526-3135(-)|eukprot:CAMPEP_0117750118 /NCGR_PEP_ID=MMETSP0947-20121206/10164_1 /TAXON_ID=44440 /ORGANISM="Chattonella subsalsa, Strain CCMP2191" /LENGTH=869 /DNA_ID=CAMNT_0005568197 /DNA_START=113 /DNA_END=2722 /DNA_ORIENTATION=-
MAASVVPLDVIKDVEEAKETDDTTHKDNDGTKPLVVKSQSQMIGKRNGGICYTNKSGKENDKAIVFGKIEKTLDSLAVQLFLGVMLFLSLYLTEFWLLSNAKTSSDTILDVLLIIIFVLFSVECIILCIVKKHYFMGFFFWMDLLGTLSVLLDISYIGSKIFSGDNENSSVLRAARAAKVGARSSRLAKLMRLFRLLTLFRTKKGEKEEKEPNAKPARALSQKLSDLLARRVAALVMLLIFIIPLLLISEIDYSPDSYLSIFEEVKAQDACDSTCFEELVAEFEEFYSDKDIGPVALTIEGVGSWDWSDDYGYLRSDNILTVDIGTDSWVQMNYSYLNQIEAWYNIAMITIVIILLVGFSLSFNSAVDKLVVIPLERMMDKLRRSAASMLRSVKAMDISEELEELDALEADMETEMLEEIIEKLARIVKSSTGNEDDVLNAEQMDASTKNWLASNYLEKGSEILKKKPRVRKRPKTAEISVKESSPGSFGSPVKDLNNELLNSWKFNPLEHETNQLYQYIRYMFLAFDCLNEFNVDDNTLAAFLKAVDSQYLKNSYHNFCHGVDVMQTVYRFLRLTSSDAIFSQLEIFALLVAALGHDVGHLGLNNAYLIKTRHALAMAHNDQSPLENMHCVKIYEMLAKPHQDIFSGLDAGEWVSARKSVIAVILGTDMVHHFQQIKKIEVFLEVNGHQFAQMANDDSYIPECMDDVANKHFLMEIFVHAADISNPAKPFKICEQWALLIMEEFFQQGDRESKEGLEISPMMDRSNTNKPTMQMNFIEFVIAPLYSGVVRLFPTLNPCLITLIDNYKQWGGQRKAELKQEEAKTETADELEKLASKIVAFENKLMDVIRAPEPMLTTRRKSRLSSLGP